MWLGKGARCAKRGNVFACIHGVHGGGSAGSPLRPKCNRGRPRKGEKRPKEPNRVARQRMMHLEEMLAAFPRPRTKGFKRNAKGY